MSRYIDADALKEDITVYYADAYHLIDSIHERIDAMPTADRHGRWMRYNIDGEPDDKDTFHWQCDQCLCTEHGRRSIPWRFCPNCGAKMDEVE